MIMVEPIFGSLCNTFGDADISQHVGGNERSDIRAIGQRRPITKTSNHTDKHFSNISAPQRYPHQHVVQNVEERLPFGTYQPIADHGILAAWPAATTIGHSIPAQDLPVRGAGTSPSHHTGYWVPSQHLQTGPKHQDLTESKNSFTNFSPSTTSPRTSSNGSDDDTDSDERGQPSHPNKFPVEIEHHTSRHCQYRRQKTRSGPKIKPRYNTTYSPPTPADSVEKIKYYEKDLVRICRCGKYNQMDGALVHGRANDCDGYEIHYSQKCKWKAYDDYKTGKRVLIRLCKCYKPF